MAKVTVMGPSSARCLELAVANIWIGIQRHTGAALSQRLQARYHGSVDKLQTQIEVGVSIRRTTSSCTLKGLAHPLGLLSDARNPALCALSSLAAP